MEGRGRLGTWQIKKPCTLLLKLAAPLSGRRLTGESTKHKRCKRAPDREGLGKKTGLSHFFFTRPFVFTRAQFIFSLFPFQASCIASKENSRTFSGGQPIFGPNYRLYSFVHIIIQQFCLSVRFKVEFSFFKEWLFFWKTSGNEIKMSLLFCQHQREIQQTSLQPKQTSDRK